jgi:hypothetical protein
MGNENTKMFSLPIPHLCLYILAISLTKGFLLVEDAIEL